MATLWKPALCLPLVVLIPIAMVSPTRVGLSAEPGRISEPADHRQASTGSRSAAKKDRISLHRESNRLVMDMKRVTGIGTTQLHAPAGGWPANAVVRLHDFADLESFSARTLDATLKCERTRPEGAPARLDCRLGDAQIDAIRQERGYFEVTLPAPLFAGIGPVEIHWVDQWR